ncbi:MAG: hypothetical protein M3024_12465 [Candidatus Dormibacteraeota bacterium]|nr:hypothetical protein [Candidatus Dormibacteraeota bacterium]
MAWLVALLFVGLHVLTADNPNSGLLLVAAALGAGVGVLRLSVLVVRAMDGSQSSAGSYERQTVVLGLLLLALALPWRVEIAIAHANVLFGWQSPAAWGVVIAIAPAVSSRLRRWEGIGFAIAGACLAAWMLWLAWLSSTPSFAGLHFSFLPIDLIGYGWYAALAAVAIAIDGAASRAAYQGTEQGVRGAGLWSLAPGVGLIRLGRKAAGRTFMGAAAFVLFLIQASAVTPVEFAYYQSFTWTPPPARSRLDVAGLTVILVLTWLLSLAGTALAIRHDREPKRQLPTYEHLGEGHR